MPRSRNSNRVYALIVIVALCWIGRNVYRRYVNNALVAAIKARNVSAVQSLLSRGADPNYRYADRGTEQQPASPQPVLDLAFSELFTPNRILNNPSNESRGGEPPPTFVPDADVEAIACLLIRKGAQVQGRGYLELACRAGDVPVARCLLDGVDLKAVDGARDAVATAFQIGMGFEGPVSMARTPTDKAEVARWASVSRQLMQLLREHGARLTLMQAEELGDTAAAKEILNGSRAGWAADGYAALCLATGKGNLEMMRQLLTQGVDPVRQPMAYEIRPGILDNIYETPLYAAVNKGNLEAVKLLLAHRVDPNGTGKHEPFALSVAAHRGDLAMVKLLLAHGPNINGGGNDAPLLNAAQGGHAALVSFLLAHGAVPNGPAEGVLSAALRKVPTLVPELLKHGANVNPTPHSVEIEGSGTQRGFGKAPIPNSPQSSNWDYLEPTTPLMTAVLYAPQYETMLLQHGAKIDADRTIMCVMAADKGRIDLLPKLLAMGADINGVDSDGETALSQCIVHAPASVKMLLEHGAQPNTEIQSGQRALLTPLAVAAMIGNAEIVRLLLAHGANVNAPARGHTILYWARKKNHPGIVALLTQAGAQE